MVVTISAIFVLLLFSAFFSGSETALTAASRARMHALEQQGDARAARLNRLRTHMERVIGTVLLGNNLVNILASVGLPTTPAAVARSAWNVERLIEHMHHDKKVSGGRIAFILVRGIGQAFVTRDVPLDEVRHLLGAAVAA